MFDPRVRVLACDNCGAPLEGARDGAELVCAYCKATNHLEFVEELPPAPALSPKERARRLYAQLAQEAEPSAGVAEYLDGSRLAAWREHEALAAWVQLRKELRETGGDAVASRFFELTKLLADAAHRAGDATRERAFLETGYAVTRIPRQRTVFAAMLAYRAARAGDHDAARSWLERCDDNTDDLEAYSKLMLAWALVKRESPEEVIGLLGAPGREQPLRAIDQPLAAVLRAEALERSGRVEEAADALVRAAEARWPQSRAEVMLARDKLGQDVAPRATSLFIERRGLDHESASASDRIGSIVTALFWGGGLGVTGIVLTFVKHMGFLPMGIFGLALGGLFVRMYFSERRQKSNWRSPIWGTVHKIKPPSGDSPGHADIEPDDARGRLERVRFDEKDHVEEGMRALLVRNDRSLQWLK